MKFIPNAVTLRVARQVLIVRKHSPAIMFGAGAATAIVATVKACQATLKVEGVLAEAEKTKSEMETIHIDRPLKYSLEDYKHDQRLLRVHVARDLAKLYAPAVGLGVLSIGLLTGAHVVLTKRNVALAAAYAGLDKVFSEYRDRVRKEYGDEKDREFRYGVNYKEVVEENDRGHEVKTVKRVGVPGKLSQYAVLFDRTNANWDPRSEYRNTFLTMQQTYANQRLHARGYVFLNDIYEDLGFPKTPAGQIVGWVLGGNSTKTAGDGYIDFGLFDPKSQEVIDFMRGEEGSLWLDFNVDGNIWDLI